MKDDAGDGRTSRVVCTLDFVVAVADEVGRCDLRAGGVAQQNDVTCLLRPLGVLRPLLRDLAEVLDRVADFVGVAVEVAGCPAEAGRGEPDLDDGEVGIVAIVKVSGESGRVIYGEEVVGEAAEEEDEV